MSHRRQNCALLVLAALVLCAGVRAFERSPFTSFVPRPLPESATADFDGDGRPDIARIQTKTGGAVSVGLSASGDAIDLGVSVASLAGGDIDHDGDIDLLGTTPSGKLVVWINDGHGRFTQQEPREARSLSDAPALSQSSDQTVVAVGSTAPQLLPARDRQYAVSSAAAGPAARSLIPSRHLLLLRPLRAPPLARL